MGAVIAGVQEGRPIGGGDEVGVVGVCRLSRRQNRRNAGIVDGTGRQAGTGVGVIAVQQGLFRFVNGAVLLEEGLNHVLRIEDGGIALQVGVAAGIGEPVVVHAGHIGHLLGVAGSLRFHHRGQHHNLV